MNRAKKILKGLMPKEKTKRLTTEESYEEMWGNRLEVIRQVIAAEHDLPRAVASARRHEENRRGTGLEPQEYICFNQVIQVPAKSAGALFRSLVVETVIEHCQPKTGRIIETGSGWGEHLSNIWDDGGPRDASYYALELTKNGQACAAALAELNERFKLTTHHFDYRNPDLSYLAPQGNHTLLFSVHSIEQVDEIPEAYILDALKMDDAVTGIHFEPIGWQMIPEADYNEFTIQHVEHCRKLAYNHNFWQLVQDMERANRIRIIKAVPNIAGPKRNPASLVIWEKV